MVNNLGCPSNIGEKEKRKRLVFGWTMLAISIVSAFTLHSHPSGALQRLILFFPLFFTCLGFIQFKQKICALHGLRGTQNLDSGDKKIVDPHLMETLRKTSTKILLFSAGIALVVTLIFLLIP